MFLMLCFIRIVSAFIPQKEKLKDMGLSKQKQEEQKQEDMGYDSHFTNLYVKNFDEKVRSDDLHKMFSRFGKIKSAVVMMNSGKSLGFGFVDFEDHESAVLVSWGCQGLQVIYLYMLVLGFATYESDSY